MKMYKVLSCIVKICKILSCIVKMYLCGAQLNRLVSLAKWIRVYLETE